MGGACAAHSFLQESEIWFPAQGKSDPFVKILI
jgi:hypothetical protein